MTTDDGDIADRLASVLGRTFAALVEIGPVERLKGGYSRRMWAFDTTTSDGATSPWILCTDSPDGVVGSDSLSRANEARLLKHVHAAGLPVPGIAVAGEGAEPFGAAWFVMQRLPGTAAVGPLLRGRAVVPTRSGRPVRPDDAAAIAVVPATLGRQKAAILARIHDLPLPEALAPLPKPHEIAALETRRWADASAQTPGAQTDTTRAALDRLRLLAPPAPERVCIVHGDYRTGNLLYDGSHITGVLDWEMAHPGDPLEDVAWAQLASWRVGTGLVGAMLTDAEWIASYESASGRTVDPVALRFWQILTGVKMSLLAWRAFERTAPGREHELLGTLFAQLQRQLDDNLA